MGPHMRILNKKTTLYGRPQVRTFRNYDSLEMRKHVKPQLRGSSPARYERRTAPIEGIRRAHPRPQGRPHVRLSVGTQRRRATLLPTLRQLARPQHSVIAEIRMSPSTELPTYVVAELRPQGIKDARLLASAETRIPAATDFRCGVDAALQRSAFSRRTPGRGDRRDPRKELRRHVRPSVRTCGFGELSNCIPQLRSRVTADVRRFSGAAYMHGHRFISSCRYP